MATLTPLPSNVEQPGFSLCALATGGATVTLGSGDFTTGNAIVAVRAGVTVKSIQFYWDGSSNKTYKVGIWDSAGTTLLSSGTIAVTAAGIYVCDLGDPQALTPYTTYYISAYENTGSKYVYISATNVNSQAIILLIADTQNKYIGAGLWRGIGQFIIGDHGPTGIDAADVYLVDPVLI